MPKSNTTKTPRFTDLTPHTAVERLEELYGRATSALDKGLEAYLQSRTVPTPEARAAFRYPLLRVTYEDKSQPHPISGRAFAKLQRYGVYETTITQPGFFRSYLLEQLGHLFDEYSARIEVTASNQEIPYPYVLERTDEVAKAGVGAGELARYFPTPNLAVVGDEIADGLVDLNPSSPFPLALFDAARVDYSLRRLVHYTGSDWRHVQRWILLTNYHRYIDKFVRLAVGPLMASGQYERLVMPGNIAIERGTPAAEAEARIAASQWHRYQMPAYHLVGAGGEGVTLVNIGVGPSNAKNITDHLAVLRPHCWLMVGHCGGLRQSQ